MKHPSHVARPGFELSGDPKQEEVTASEEIVVVVFHNGDVLREAY